MAQLGGGGVWVLHACVSVAHRYGLSALARDWAHQAAQKQWCDALGWCAHAEQLTVATA